MNASYSLDFFSMSLVDRINSKLPQTQCTRCGYNGCLPYAEAVASGVPHNQCPPGGNETIQSLSDLLYRPFLPLNPEHGELGPRKVAFIDESQCIGCTKCIQACPVDAIAGAAKWMHTIITDECSGCELCVEPCPVDCISMIPAPSHLQPLQLSHEGQEALRQQFETRYHNRLARIAHTEQQEKIEQAEKNAEAKLAYIQAAQARVQAKRKRKPLHES
jgi:electron transport complex protein RnfB